MNNFEIKNNDCHAALAMTKSVQSGRSMIEMLGVLAIIGVLSVGGIAGYSKAMNKYRINKAIEQITLISGNIRTFFGRQKITNIGAECYYVNNNIYTTIALRNDGCPAFKKAKIIPDEMLTLDADGKITAITGAFGERVEIKQYDSGDGNTSIEYYIGANEEACIELATYDWRSVNINYIGVLSNGDGSKSSRFSSLPVPIDSAVTACDKIISTGVSVRLKFTIKVL